MRCQGILLVVLALLVAGCGGSDQPSAGARDLAAAQRDYAARLAPVCAAAEARLAVIVPGRRTVAAAQRWQREADRFQSALQRVPFPRDLRPEAGRIILAAHTLEESLVQVVDAARSSDGARVLRLIGEIRVHGGRLRETARGLGGGGACGRVGADAERRLLPALRRLGDDG